MTYQIFKEKVRETLKAHPSGLTWMELREAAFLPYERPCPIWTKQLENEIHLIRSGRRGRALIWKIEAV